MEHAPGDEARRAGLLARRKVARQRLTTLHSRYLKGAADPQVDLEFLRVTVDIARGVSQDLKVVDPALAAFWVEGEESELETQKMMEYQDKADEIEFGFQHLCRVRSSSIPLARESPQVPDSDLNDRLDHSSFNCPHVKLPKLVLPEFDGSLLQWQEFSDQFRASVERNPTLSSVDKMVYLHSCVSGVAKKAIANYPLTESSYADAWSTLERQFGDSVGLMDAYVQDLQNLPQVRDLGATDQLRELVTRCSSRLRGLRSLDMDVDSMGPFIVPTILGALPFQLVVQFRLKFNQSEATLVKLMDFLEKQLGAREGAARLLGDVKVKKPSSSRDCPSAEMTSAKDSRLFRPGRPSTTSALVAKVDKPPEQSRTRSSQRRFLPCLFCDQHGHWSSACPQVRSVEERKSILQSQDRCFLCLKPGYGATTCGHFRQTCRGCGQRHHASICPNSSNISNNTVAAPLRTTAMGSSGPHVTSPVFLGTASVWIQGEDGKVLGRCLLDGGSQTSFIHSRVASRIGARRLRECSTNVTAFGARNAVTTIRTLYEIHLQSTNGGRIISVQVLNSDRLCGQLPTFADEGMINRLEQQGIFLADPPVPVGQEAPIDVLLGADCYWQLVTGRAHALSASLGLLDTHLGWMIVGQATGEEKSRGLDISVGHITLEDQIKDFWDVEHMGLVPSRSMEDPVLEHLSSTISRDPTGRYIVRLPWNEKAPSLASNWGEAYRRLRGLAKRLHSSCELRVRYHDAVQAYMDLDHAETVAPEQSAGSPLYYLPHHAVIREDRVTTKVRVVFDASSHGKGQFCLNDCLHTGPSLNPECAALLVRWRSYVIPFVADIVKAFLQVSVATEDRDGIRFLWLDPNFWDEPFSEDAFRLHLRLFRMKVVIFGANCSPFLLCATVRHHAEKFSSQYPVASKMLDKNLYVDDLMGGGRDVNEAIERYQQVKQIMVSAQMQLSKWATASPELHHFWKYNNEDVAADDLPLAPHGSTKVLGLHWKCQEDSFYFDRKIGPPEVCTKRNVLRLTAQLFDPLGFLGPFTIRAKLLMQQLWLAGTDWDSSLEEPHLASWMNWLSELPASKEVRVPRCLLSKPLQDNTSWELHVFTDASERAYGAAVYLLVYDVAGLQPMLVMSRNRVAPLKKITLPRLELLGALAGARLLDYILPVLDFHTSPSKIVYWTDSQIVLWWIKGHPRRWKTFVFNRVQEIQDLSTPGSWRFCPGMDNPADLLTRGEDLRCLKGNLRWWHGPIWLSEGVTEWPPQVQVDSLSTGEEVMKIDCLAVSTTPPLIEIQRFSTLTKLLRVTAWVRRCLPHVAPHEDILTTDELSRGHRYWLRVTQEEAFPTELACLQTCQPLPGNSSILPLGPFLDEDLIRIRGRLKFANLPYQCRHPILLPPGGPFVALLLMDIHVRLFHAGPSEILAEVRETFWMIRGRKACQRTVNQCLVCRRMKVRPASAPVAPLPADRVNVEPPFAIVGVDFAGPLYLKTSQRNAIKSYFVIFSCAVTRAIHVELVSSLETEAFLLSLRRFFARYGVSHTIYSDNGRTFLRAEKELRPVWGVLTSSVTQDFFSLRGVTWKRIVERAAWWGGFWERMVRSVKERLRRTIGRASLNFEELSTVLLEISAAINSRPLCYQSENPQEATALTPGHFLFCGHPAVFHSPVTAAGLTSTQRSLQKRWRQRQHLLDQFWDRWKKEYLLQLRSFHFSRPAHPTELKVGDLVILTKEKFPRHCWLLARVTATFPGRDGFTRAYEVQTATGSRFRRAIQHLCPLEA